MKVIQICLDRWTLGGGGGGAWGGIAFCFVFACQGFLTDRNKVHLLYNEFIFNDAVYYVTPFGYYYDYNLGIVGSELPIV